MLDDARALKGPRLHDGRVIFVLKRDRNGAQGVLIAVANVVEPLVQIERTNYPALHRDVSGFVEPGNLANAVFL